MNVVNPGFGNNPDPVPMVERNPSLCAGAPDYSKSIPKFQDGFGAICGQLAELCAISSLLFGVGHNRDLIETSQAFNQRVSRPILSAIVFSSDTSHGTCSQTCSGSSLGKKPGCTRFTFVQRCPSSSMPYSFPVTSVTVCPASKILSRISTGSFMVRYLILLHFARSRLRHE